MYAPTHLITKPSIKMHLLLNISLENTKDRQFSWLFQTDKQVLISNAWTSSTVRLSVKTSANHKWVVKCTSSIYQFWLKSETFEKLIWAADKNGTLKKNSSTPLTAQYIAFPLFLRIFNFFSPSRSYVIWRDIQFVFLNRLTYRISAINHTSFTN